MISHVTKQDRIRFYWLLGIGMAISFFGIFWVMGRAFLYEVPAKGDPNRPVFLMMKLLPSFLSGTIGFAIIGLGFLMLLKMRARLMDAEADQEQENLRPPTT